jgi:hypothetical protein
MIHANHRQLAKFVYAAGNFFGQRTMARSLGFGSHTGNRRFIAISLSH